MKSFKLNPVCAALAGVFALAAVPALAQQQAKTLPEVVVEGNRETTYGATGNTAGALGERALRDTPFSVEVVTSKEIANQQATLIDEALKFDPAVASFNNGYIGESSGITIRGLQLDLLNGYKIDGLAMPNWASDVPLEHFEQVELLKGLSGFMYGFGQPGGIVNFVTKRSTAVPTASATLGYMNDSVFRGHADFGGRFANNRFGYRVNAVREQGDTFVDDGYIKRTSASVALDAALTPDLLWSVDALYQKRRTDGTYFALYLDPGVDVPPPISGSRRLAQPFTFHETEHRSVGTELLWQIAPQWDLRLAYRKSDQDRENADSEIVVNDNAGNYTEGQYRWLTRYKQEQARATLAGKFATGPIGHHIVAGVSSLQQDREAAQFGFAVLGTGNLASPGLFEDPMQPLDRNTLPTSEITERAVFLSDTLAFNKQWSAILGLRYSNFEQDAFDSDGTVSTRYSRSPVTPTVALIYKPVEPVSLYGSYVESLEAGGAAPLGTNNAEEVFGPLRSKQLEFGVKADYRNWGMNAALFRIERGLEYINDANFYVQDGETRYDGLDVSGHVRFARQWTFNAGAMWLDARNVEGAPEVRGRRGEGAPRFTAKAKLDYAVPQVAGLTLSGGAQYVGRRAVQADNTNFVDDFVLFDLGARYQTKAGGTPLTFRLNVDNVANEKYWVPSYGFFLTQGAPRVIRASVQMDF
jgi:iron complex outermembrane receptor protein